jgi:hypothetical protein
MVWECAIKHLEKISITKKNLHIKYKFISYPDLLHKSKWILD